jgi:hypothetical protein
MEKEDLAKIDTDSMSEPTPDVETEVPSCSIEYYLIAQSRHESLEEGINVIPTYLALDPKAQQEVQEVHTVTGNT